MASVLHRRLVIFCILTVCLLTRVVLGVAQEATPLPTDPAVHIGQLENGMTYWVRSHATPPGKIALWLRIGTGSLNEADGQEGLAHYLEHMAFKGTTHFPARELISFFESIGLRFGQHQNAFTGFDQTTYTLSLPNTRPETLEKGLLYLADVAFRVSMAAEDVEKERSVILEENRARKGVGQRLLEKLLPELLPGSRVARRLPIGLESTIAQLQRDDFLAYYRTWYHPAKVTLLVVGDAPVDTMVAAIKTHFGSWQRDTPPPADAEPGIQPYTAPLPIVLSDPELTSAGVESMALRPRLPVRTTADFRRQMLERLSTWMVNRRMEQRIREGTAAYQSANVRHHTFLSVVEQISANAEAAPANWTAALRELIGDIQSARLYGFTAQELEIAKRALLAAAEHAAQTEATQDAQAFLGAMNRARSAGELPRAAVHNLALLQQLLPSVSGEEVTAVFARNFAPEQRAYIVSLPEKPGVEMPSREALGQVVRAALAAPVVAWQGKERPAALLAQDPTPGQIVSQSHFAPLAITQATLSNNIRLHYRFMDFKKDHVTVTLTLAGGTIQEQAEQQGLTEVATLALTTPATSRLSSTDIRDIMTGKKVRLEARTTEDTVVLSITGAPEDLADGLRLAYILFQDATIEPASVALWKEQKLQELAAARSRIDFRAREAVSLLISGNDPRRRPLTPEQVQARASDIPTAQTWLNGILRTAPLEVAVVGDVPEQQALSLMTTFLGALPARPRHNPALVPLRQVAGFSGPQERSVEVETITPRAHPILLWRSADWQDVRGRRLMFIASRILERRVRQEVREERGLTYSTSTYAQPNKAYPVTSALYVEFTADPDKVDAAVALAKTVVERFASEGPSEAEMDTVRKQMQNYLETLYKEPRFWVDVLSDLEYHGTQLTDLEGAIDKFLAFSKEEIAAEVRKTIVPERFATVIARPRTSSTAEERRSTN
ncbi:MAG: M16 family metallopeptidase [Candidatus Tectimicrobiota bacterium]